MKNYIAPLSNTNLSGDHVPASGETEKTVPTPAHITAIAAPQVAITAAIEQEGQEQPWSSGELLSELEHEGAFHFGAYAYSGGPLAAYILSRRVLDELHIHRVCTRPEFRRQGFARALIDHTLNAAAGRGIGTVFLEVAAQNHAAVALYKAAGFVEEYVRKNYYTNSDDALVMKKCIGKETEKS